LEGNKLSDRTIGQQEDDAAFEEVCAAFWRGPGRFLNFEYRTYAPMNDAMRLAWDTALKRGEEKRGCCKE